MDLKKFAEERGLVGIEEFQERFDVKNAFGPPDENGKSKWNRCWSEFPKKWLPAIEDLIDKIKAKYRVETIADDPNDPVIEVWIDQVKEKFGSLRFYYNTISNGIYEDIYKMVEECEKRLTEEDSNYGKY